MEAIQRSYRERFPAGMALAFTASWSGEVAAAFGLAKGEKTRTRNIYVRHLWQQLAECYQVLEEGRSSPDCCGGAGLLLVIRFPGVAGLPALSKSCLGSALLVVAISTPPNPQQADDEGASSPSRKRVKKN